LDQWSSVSIVVLGQFLEPGYCSRACGVFLWGQDVFSSPLFPVCDTIGSFNLRTTLASTQMLLLRDYMAGILFCRLSSTHRNERWKTWNSRKGQPRSVPKRDPEHRHGTARNRIHLDPNRPKHQPDHTLWHVCIARCATRGKHERRRDSRERETGCDIQSCTAGDPRSRRRRYTISSASGAPMLRFNARASIAPPAGALLLGRPSSSFFLIFFFYFLDLNNFKFRILNKI
jgi:hypothetical protein